MMETIVDKKVFSASAFVPVQNSPFENHGLLAGWVSTQSAASLGGLPQIRPKTTPTKQGSSWYLSSNLLEKKVKPSEIELPFQNKSIGSKGYLKHGI